MARLFHLLATALSFIIVTSAQCAEPTTWHGIDGWPLCSGSFLSASPDFKYVTIIKADGTTAVLQSDTLSAADRAFLLAHTTKGSEFQQAVRAWTSSNGKYHVDAKVLSVVAMLTSADGKVVSVPIDKLSTADRAYLDRLQNEIKVAELPAIDDPFSTISAVVAHELSQASAPLKEKPVAAAGKANYRDWTSANGIYVFKAKLVDATTREVRLRRLLDDHMFPLTDLSQEDQKYVANWLEENKRPPVVQP